MAILSSSPTTAGLRPVDIADPHAGIESEGIRRAKAQAEQADIRLLVFDATALPQRDPGTLALVNDSRSSFIIKQTLRLSIRRMA